MMEVPFDSVVGGNPAATNIAEGGRTGDSTEAKRFTSTGDDPAYFMQLNDEGSLLTAKDNSGTDA